MQRLITKTHQKGDAASEAVYSECLGYRYALTRVWNASGPRVLFIMLNPSKATEVENDPTIERCEWRARALGFGGFRAANIFAWRETDPSKMKRAADPVGAANDEILRQSCDWADQVICGWGAHGAHLDRGAQTAGLLAGAGETLYCFGTTKAGHPRHPLYIAYKTKPEKWDSDELLS